MTTERKVLAILFVAGAAMLVLLTLFIPNILWLRKKANEALAVKLVKSINAAEQEYSATHPAEGFTCTLAALDIKRSQFDLDKGVMSGYYFALRDCRPLPVNEAKPITTYKLFALPIALGKTGDKCFCSDQTEQITIDPRGGKECITPR